MAKSRSNPKHAKDQLSLFDTLEDLTTATPPPPKHRSQAGSRTQTPQQQVSATSETSPSEVQGHTSAVEQPQEEPRKGRPNVLLGSQFISNDLREGDRVTFSPDRRTSKPQGVRARAEANIAALEVLLRLEAEQRWATPAEQDVLAQYSSWGAASEVFDRRRTNLADLRERLEKVVDGEVYRSLEQTSLTAFFTPDNVIEPVWDALALAGYETGPVLEPGCGTGNFIGRAPETGDVVGVEVDPISAAIASQLYPEANVVTSGFEAFRPRDNSFTAAVGNVPFGDLRVYDPQHNPKNFSIHNHFILKSMDLVAPGGYVAMVTSAFTADSLNSEARQEMIARADLISACRLPKGTFAKESGTDVTSDLLVFRVREPGQAPTEASTRFVQTDEIETNSGDLIRVNGYFVDNPEAVLGSTQVNRDKFGNSVLEVRPDENQPLSQVLPQRLREDVLDAVDNGRGLSVTPASDGDAASLIATADNSDVPVNSVRYTKDDKGQVVFEQMKGSTQKWAKINFSGEDKQEWVQLLDLRDTTVRLRQAYRDQSEEIPQLQAALNEQYDAYFEQYGAINRYQEPKPKDPTKKQRQDRYKELAAEWREANLEDADVPLPADVEEELQAEAARKIQPTRLERKHWGVLRKDPYFYGMTAIEVFDEETRHSEKGRIFTGDPAGYRPVVDYVDTVADGIDVSLDRLGVIDPVFISDLTNLTQEVVEEELISSGRAFRDPQNPSVFIRAEIYLSGVVKDTLEVAQKAARDDERFAVNVEALKEALPTPITEGVDIRPGATWIDQSYYRQFISQTFGIPEHKFILSHRNDQWSLEVDKNWWRDHGHEHDLQYGLVAANNRSRSASYNFESKNLTARTFANQGVATNLNSGTVVTAHQTFEALLNLSSPKVNWSKAWQEQFETGSEAVNREATAFAYRKSMALREQFTDWITSDPQRRAEIYRAYNDRFNSYVATTWRPTQRTMPGLAEGRTPYTYQQRAIERIVNEPAVLLNHVVGAGKTGEFLMGAMELKRLGKIHQPWIVVPNHLAEQVTKEANEWYPNAKVLSGAGIDSKEDRRHFVAQSTADNWDLVVCPESVFQRIPMSKDTRLEYQAAQIETLREELLDAQVRGENVSTKQIQRALKDLQHNQDKLLDSPSDPGLEFESTPCDYLIVDEAHEYKNLHRVSKVNDISHPGSQKASDLDMKLSYLRKKAERADGTQGPVATFATGTPIANNLAEIWVMAKYLRPDLLERAGISGVTAWAATMTDSVTDVEVSVSGNLKQRTRVGQYLNVGDLVALTEPFIDVVTRDDLETKLPELIGGQNTAVEFDLDEETRDFLYDISQRPDINWNALVQGDSTGIDLALKQLSDGRKAALDPRLVNLDYEGYSPRVRAVTENVTRIWQANKDNVYSDDTGKPSAKTGGLQIIFCDSSTPKADSSQFNIYSEIRNSLRDKGMDPARIAFIHEWEDDRKTLFAKCRNGDIDVLIGSTQKLGTGVNVQRRATALHHVDVPWRPADLEQREGRVIRQGNENDNVEICNYIAKGSTDAVAWQTILRKLKMIDQFKNADRSLRQMEPLETGAAEAAAHNKAAATGDSRYIDLLNLNKRVDDLQGQYQEWQAAQESTKLTRHHLDTVITQAGRWQAAAEPLTAPATKWAATENKTWTTPTGRTVTDRGEAAREIAAGVRDVFRNRDHNTHELASIGGIRFGVKYTAYNTAATVFPMDLPKITGLERQEFIFEWDAIGLPDFNPEKATNSEYGMLSRLENYVKSFPKKRDIVEANTTRAQIELDQLASRGAGQTFALADELAQVQTQRDELQAQLSRVNESEETARLNAERQARNQLKGRELGWSLRLNPTKRYAEMVELTSQEDCIYRAKRDELNALYSNGVIDLDDYTHRLDRLSRLAKVIDESDYDAPDGLADDAEVEAEQELAEETPVATASGPSDTGEVVKPVTGPISADNLADVAHGQSLLGALGIDVSSQPEVRPTQHRHAAMPANQHDDMPARQHGGNVSGGPEL